MIAAIILAAGASQRMGYPKALLAYRGATFLEAILGACEAAGATRRIVVLGENCSNVLSQCGLRDQEVEAAVNSDSSTGPLRSLQIGIRCVLNHPVEAVIAWHVDRPHVSVETIRSLVAAFRKGDGPVVVPSYKGKRGHPVIFGRTVFEELLGTADSEGARAVVRADPSRVTVVPVDDPAVVEDIDTPEQYRDLLRRSDEGGATPPTGPVQ